MEVNFELLKRRVVGWMRDLLLVFGMWCIWLVRDYVANEGIKNVVTGFLITMIAIVILIREYVVTLDQKIIGYELELERIKRRG